MQLLRGVQPGDGRHLPELRRRTCAAATANPARMNYRHAYHAGNFADVHKHAALTAILLHLRKKDAPFALIDTHAGRGLYDLSGDEARRSGEVVDGVAKLAGHVARTPALATYLDVVRGFGPQRYPGSPLIAAELLRPQDRLVAMEKHAEEFAGLRAALLSFENARAIAADGYAQLPKLLPPPERRGLVLIDPPYEEAREMQQVAKAFADAYRRFAHGIVLIWHPLKSSVPAEALAGELKTAGASKLLSLAFDVGMAAGDAAGRLSASGLLAINPPYGFAEDMRAAQEELLPPLRRNANARASVTWLAGGP
jgi:23S rRNA (adenine2030-N6)-methyltransferase